MNFLKRSIVVLLSNTLWVIPAHAGVFDTYEGYGALFRNNLNQKISTETLEAINKNNQSKDAALFLLEKARLLQVDHQYEESAEAYKKAFELFDKQNNRAKVSVTRVGFKALSMISNDSVVPYLVPRYEQVLAHVSQAKNYIFLNDAEAAGVEMRKAQQLQREIELDHEKELTKKKSVFKPNAETALSQLDEAFVGLDPITGKIKSSYQNGYAFYMAANLWEAIGEYNGALVDYKKAYELQSDKVFANDVKRLDSLTTRQANSIPVVVFIEQGTVPKKIENKLALPLPDGILNIAFATYEPSTYVAPQFLKLRVNNQSYQQSYLVSDIGALAVKELKERTLNTIASQIVRATTKMVAQKQLGNQLGALGQLAGNLMNVATERADLRAWSTLPSNTQVAKFDLKPGKHKLEILGSGAKKETLNLDLNSNQTAFVYVNDVNNKISTSISFVANQ